MKSLTQLQERSEEELALLLNSETHTSNIQSFLISLEDVIQERIDQAMNEHLSSKDHHEQ